MKIVIIDYGLGNLRSVYNAFSFIGAKARISGDPKDIDSADKVVLPGVGAFQDTMTELEEKGLNVPLRKFITSGKAYLGICLGLQILFEGSEEGSAKGLCVFKGQVKRFKKEADLKIPHMGWNSVNMKADTYRPMRGIENDSYFYFVHSYYAEPEDKSIVAGMTEYGSLEFASMIAKDNIFATQFHPERSQGIGLGFLRNFVEI